MVEVNPRVGAVLAVLVAFNGSRSLQCYLRFLHQRSVFTHRPLYLSNRRLCASVHANLPSHITGQTGKNIWLENLHYHSMFTEISRVSSRRDSGPGLRDESRRRRLTRMRRLVPSTPSVSDFLAPRLVPALLNSFQPRIQS